MATATDTMFETLRDVTMRIWDWPNVPGARYRARDQKKLRTLSHYFSTAAGITAAAVSVSYGNPVAATIGLSAVGVIAGHYAAGVVVEVQRRQRARRLDSW